MRAIVKCRNCGIKWERIISVYDGGLLELTEDLQYNCPNCNSNYFGYVTDDDPPNIRTVKTGVPKDLLSNCTVTIKFGGLKRWRLRLWIGTQFIKLGASIMRVSVILDEKH